MAAAGAQPIVDPTPSPMGLIQSLIGQNQNTNTDVATQQLIQALTSGTQAGTQAGTQTGTTGGTTSGTTVNTANIAPLLQAFAASSGGMDPASMQALITSIFQEGARAVPELTQQFANSTGSRVQGNSGLNLALGDLNRQLSTQAAQAILTNQQQSQATAGNIAANIAANTRETQQQQQQTGQTAQATAANTTQANTENRAQTQTGTTNTTQQQQTAANPMNAALLGLGGTALNFLDKRGALDSLLGRSTTPTPGGVGTISGSGNLAAAPVGGSTLANSGGGSAGFLSSAPAASQGAITMPVAPQPTFQPLAAPNSFSTVPGAAPAPAASFSLGGGGGTGITDFGGGGFAPAAGGITGVGGFGDSSGGFLGTAANQGFGALPDTASYFGTGGTGSLGSNLSFGSNPYGYGGTSGGITDLTGGVAPSGNLLSSAGAADPGFFGSLGNFGSSIFGGVQDAFGGIGDFFSSFFADGGQVGAVDVGANPTRVRNANYMGPRQRDSQSEAMNYDGYAPASVGASVPAGGSPSLGVGTSGMMGMGAGAGGIGLSAPSAMMAPGTQTLGQPTQAAQFIDPSQRAREAFFAQMLQQQAQAAAAQQAALAAGGTGGSGGVGEGAAPGQNEADNGAAGIGPSGIAAAPQGTSSAVSTGLGLAGMPAPGLSAFMSMIAAMAAAVNAGNQPSPLSATAAAMGAGAGTGNQASAPEGAVSSAVSQSSIDAIGMTPIGASDAAGGLSGAPDAGSQGDASGTTGTSAGNSADASGSNADYADGGLVRGMGTGISDSIRVKSKQPGGKDIRYSDGEFVIPKDVVDTLGVNHFESLLDAFHTPASLQ